MRIGSSLFGVDLTAQYSLLQAVGQLNQSSERLATLRQINRGSDDPAGLIAAKQLEAELASIQAAESNIGRAVSLVHIADSAFNSVGNLIQSIRGSVVEAAQGFLSTDTLGANQLQIDAALEAINRIGSYTSRMIPSGTVTYSLSPDVNETSQLTMPRIDTALLGGDVGHLSDLASGGSASLAKGDFAKAIKILDVAQSQILGSRAQFGAFEKYTAESFQEVLGRMEINISSSLSQIQDTDVALEASRYVRAQTLLAGSMATVALTGQRQTSALGLLRSLARK